MKSSSSMFNNLYNVPFSSLMLYSFFKSYEQEAETGVPILLSYLVLPIIFHRLVRETLPKHKNTSFPVWLRENDNIRINLDRRAALTVPIITDCLKYLYAKDVLKINDGRITLNNSIKLNGLNTYLSLEQETLVIYKASQFLGRWFGRIESPSLIFGLLGVKP